MSYFKSERATTTVKLPSDPKLWVKVFSKLTWNEEKMVGQARSTGSVTADAILNCMIADWNLTDDSGQVAPVDAQHIDQLERDDAIAVIDAIQGIAVASEGAQAKKDSSPKSPKL